MPEPSGVFTARSPMPIANPGLEYLRRRTMASIRRSSHSATARRVSCLSRPRHPEKESHLAIEIAKRSGLRLKIAAIPHDEAYFRELIAPHIDGDQIQFVGAVERAAATSF